MQNIPTLKRQIGLPQAVLLGLGSMVGSGVFVTLVAVTQTAGPWLIWVVLAATVVAGCNALSSAQLAARYPVSGGTYEYGYRLLHPTLGFTAGWMFLLAKSASAATAALGTAIYLADIVPLLKPVPTNLISILVTLGLTAIVTRGIRTSALANAVMVLITLSGLAWLIGAAIYHQSQANTLPNVVVTKASTQATLEAIALMFVAFTGYGRLATLGEEVIEPRRTIPIAIILTLILCGVLYVCVAASIQVAFKADANRTSATLSLSDIATMLDAPWLSRLIPLAALTSLLGVQLNLILGLSRVLFAMARRGDMPRSFATMSPASSTPIYAVLAVSVLIACLALGGNIRLAWSFSAFTVLIYYAITNLAALQLPREHRLYPRIITYIGLVACLSLAFAIERQVWLGGSTLIAIGLVWHYLRRHARLAPSHDA